MAANLEVYVRRRRSIQEDARTGTLASGPLRIRVLLEGVEVAPLDLPALLGAVVSDGRVLIEVDELAAAADPKPDDPAWIDPPSRDAGKLLGDAELQKRTPGNS